MKKLLCLLIISVAITASQDLFCGDSDAAYIKLRRLQEMAGNGLSTLPEHVECIKEPVIIDPLNFTNEFWKELLGFSLVINDAPKSLINLNAVRGIDELYFIRKLSRVYRRAGLFVIFELEPDCEKNLCYDCRKLLNKHYHNWSISFGASFHDYCFYTEREYLVDSLNKNNLGIRPWEFSNAVSNI